MDTPSKGAKILKSDHIKCLVLVQIDATTLENNLALICQMEKISSRHIP